LTIARKQARDVPLVIEFNEVLKVLFGSNQMKLEERLVAIDLLDGRPCARATLLSRFFPQLARRPHQFITSGA